MTLPMDIRLAADGAKFGFVFARRGIVPAAVVVGGWVWVWGCVWVWVWVLVWVWVCGCVGVCLVVVVVVMVVVSFHTQI